MFQHGVVDHAESTLMGIHTNGLEISWSLLKRKIGCTCPSVEPFHRFRYLGVPGNVARIPAADEHSLVKADLELLALIRLLNVSKSVFVGMTGGGITPVKVNGSSQKPSADRSGSNPRKLCPIELTNACNDSCVRSDLAFCSVTVTIPNSREIHSGPSEQAQRQRS
jgi:hypothetical protein